MGTKLSGTCQDVSRNHKWSQSNSMKNLSLRIKYFLKKNVFEVLMVCRKTYNYLFHCLGSSYASVLLVSGIYLFSQGAED